MYYLIQKYFIISNISYFLIIITSLYNNYTIICIINLYSCKIKFHNKLQFVDINNYTIIMVLNN